MKRLRPEKYNMENIKRSCNNPRLIKSEFTYIYKKIAKNAKSKIHKKIAKQSFEREYGEGVDVMGEDWDNLIILDACRYDVFNKYCEIDESLSSVVSKGSHSAEFFDANFSGQSFHDAVYITGNPHAEKFSNETFHRVIKSYSEDYKKGKKRYEKRSASRIYDITVNNQTEFQNKRLIVHFMQPHSPYIGPKANRLREELSDKEDLRFLAWEPREKYELAEEDNYIKNLMKAARQGYISNEELLEVYVENLEIVLDYARMLISELDGKTVLTSDHGELLGNPSRRILPQIYGHPKNVYVPELRVVPWLVVESDNRREIISEEPVGVDTVDENVVEERLSALGYT